MPRYAWRAAGHRPTVGIAAITRRARRVHADSHAAGREEKLHGQAGKKVAQKSNASGAVVGGATLREGLAQGRSDRRAKRCTTPAFPPSSAAASGSNPSASVSRQDRALWSMLEVLGAVEYWGVLLHHRMTLDRIASTTSESLTVACGLPLALAQDLRSGAAACGVFHATDPKSIAWVAMQKPSAKLHFSEAYGSKVPLCYRHASASASRQNVRFM